MFFYDVLQGCCLWVFLNDFFCSQGETCLLMFLFLYQRRTRKIGCSFLRFNIEENVEYWEQKWMKICFYFILVVLSSLQHSHFLIFSLPFFSTFFMDI